MPAARNHRLSINLLPQDPFYETPVGRIMAWASTVGRYLVIFTELVVIISFASRFKLDRDITDLNTDIQQKSQIVESYGNLEQNVRLVQKKIDFLVQQRNSYSSIDILDMINSSLPRDVALSLVQVYTQEVQVTGTALSPEALAVLVRALQAQPIVSALFMDQIKSSTQGATGLEFSLRLQLRPRVGTTTTGATTGSAAGATGTP